MSRIFNNREGFGPKDDRVIRRWHEEMPSGPLKGQRIDPKEFRDAIDLYYELSGWDKNGKPARGKLPVTQAFADEIGADEFAPDAGSAAIFTKTLVASSLGAKKCLKYWENGSIPTKKTSEQKQV